MATLSFPIPESAGTRNAIDSPANSTGEPSSGVKRALLIGLGIMVVVVGVFVIAQLLSSGTSGG